MADQNIPGSARLGLRGTGAGGTAPAAAGAGAAVLDRDGTAAGLPDGFVHDLVAPDGALRLTAAHRCDTGSCGAQAYAAAFHLAEHAAFELLFCRHHAEAARPALAAAGLVLLTDYTALGHRLDVSA